MSEQSMSIEELRVLYRLLDKQITWHGDYDNVLYKAKMYIAEVLGDSL